MHHTSILIALLSQLPFCVAGTQACGGGAPCTGTERCTTAILGKPITTTVTACVPAPTCLSVYAECILPGHIIGRWWALLDG
ncbi:Uncharacterized protein PECH_003626 [Penicillium ucsense]|uniref:Hydrophobin n=1 Tax=Penicillium ucsense TaxID=2839758 RepID=A0A8J8VVU6_9EURO|nr:Uncharacterized protein PECM_003121 [Penicillium ucsense]KAF7729280.1 Uncharacterized protein PECH_003626 [Penicillium ucsense]